MTNKLTEFVFERIGVPSYNKYLNLASFRHKLVSGNVANAATPEFRRRDIDFQGEFAKATGQSERLKGVLTDEKHIPLGSHPDSAPDVKKTPVPEGDLNSVDIDQEVATLSKNELLYSIGARLLQRKFDGVRNAITSK
ncbi:MAG TPA: flagellar basal body rod protein FlgB [Candidatus Deferrimicrobium sp.]|nr:flagellar basal body rod protein FlgB [Candidatus Deferrimicrobium sp.]